MKVVNNMAQYYTTSDIPVVLKLAQEIRVVLAEPMNSNKLTPS